MDDCLTVKHKVYIAALLSICPGLGHLYTGHIEKSFFLYVTFIVVSWGTAVIFMYIDSLLISLFILLIPPTIYLLILFDSIRSTRSKPITYRFKWQNNTWVYTTIFILLLVTVNPLMDLLVGKHIVRAYHVATESMRPSVLRNDLILINKLRTPKRGDIALIDSNDTNNSNSLFYILKNNTLRRIIAVSGDNVFIQGRKVFVNNKVITEPYIENKNSGSYNILNSDNYVWGPITIPNKMFYVLSDARQYTYDSRVFGLVNNSEILGIATKVFWSWDFDTGTIRWGRTGMSLERETNTFDPEK